MSDDTNVVAFPLTVLDSKDVMFNFFSSDFVIVIGEYNDDGRLSAATNLPSLYMAKDWLEASLEEIREAIRVEASQSE